MTDKAICLQCNQEFEQDTYKRKYCTSKCQEKAQQEKWKSKRNELQEVIKKNIWQKKSMLMYAKFVELFGDKFSCELCNLSNEDSIKKYGLPLISKLNKDVDDWRVLDPENWRSYCLKCYSNILIEAKK